MKDTNSKDSIEGEIEKVLKPYPITINWTGNPLIEAYPRPEAIKALATYVRQKQIEAVKAERARILREIK